MFRENNRRFGFRLSCIMTSNDFCSSSNELLEQNNYCFCYLHLAVILQVNIGRRL